MDEKKSFEIGDEMLESVAGGASNEAESQIGMTANMLCRNRNCSEYMKYRKAVVIRMDDSEHVVLKMECCGHEFVSRA